MGLIELARGHQQTRDSIGANPEVLPIPKITEHRIKIWEEPGVVYDYDINNSFIAGHSDNGVVGTTTGIGGGQVVVGPTSNTETLLRVVPKGDNWVTFIRESPSTNSTESWGLVDSGSTATISTVNHRIDFTPGDYVEFIIAYNHKTYRQIQVVLDESSQRTNFVFDDNASDDSTFPYTFPITFEGATVTLLVSSDGGASWEEVVNGVVHTFTTPGTHIRFRIRNDSGNNWIKTMNDNGEELPLLIKVIE